MELQCQYAFVKASRQVLLEYCAGIAAADFVAENSAFGRGSIRNLLVHIGHTYAFWIGGHGLQQTMAYPEYNSIKDVVQAQAFFRAVDALVARFLDVYAGSYLDERTWVNEGQCSTASPLQLFTHVITHEFHHKGQVLSLSRHWGYVPVDTDIIR